MAYWEKEAVRTKVVLRNVSLKKLSDFQCIGYEYGIDQTKLRGTEPYVECWERWLKKQNQTGYTNPLVQYFPLVQRSAETRTNINEQCQIKFFEIIRGYTKCQILLTE